MLWAILPRSVGGFFFCGYFFFFFYCFSKSVRRREKRQKDSFEFSVCFKNFLNTPTLRALFAHVVASAGVDKIIALSFLGYYSDKSIYIYIITARRPIDFINK